MNLINTYILFFREMADDNFKALGTAAIKGANKSEAKRNAAVWMQKNGVEAAELTEPAAIRLKNSLVMYETIATYGGGI